MKEGFDFDGALKELFQQDRPTLLQQLSGGVKVREFLNVELPRVQARRVDLVLLLEDILWSTSKAKARMTARFPTGWFPTMGC